MKALLSLLLTLTSCTALVAQKNTFVTVKAGTNIMDVLSTADVVYYPDFTNGVILFGTELPHKLN